MKSSVTRMVRLLRYQEHLEEALAEAAQLERIGGGPGEDCDVNRVRLLSVMRKDAKAELEQLARRGQEANGGLG